MHRAKAPLYSNGYTAPAAMSERLPEVWEFFHYFFGMAYDKMVTGKNMCRTGTFLGNGKNETMG